MADKYINYTDSTGGNVVMRVDALGDGYYAFAHTDGGPGWDTLFGIATTDGHYGAYVSTDMTSSDTVAVSDYPTTDQYLVITDIWYSSEAANVFTFTEETSGKVKLRAYLPANSGMAHFKPRGKYKLFTKNKRLMAQASATGGVCVLVGAYSEK